MLQRIMQLEVEGAKREVERQNGRGRQEIEKPADKKVSSNVSALELDLMEKLDAARKRAEISRREVKGLF